MQEFAFGEGKRDDIFSPTTSGHVLKLLPTIFWQRVSEEEGARKGERAFSQMLGCLDVKDALKVSLRGEDSWRRGIYLDRELEQEHDLTFSQSTSPRSSAISSVLSVDAWEEVKKSIILTHVDDLIFTGCSKYINEIFLPKIQGWFDTRVGKIEKIGDELNLLRRKYKLGLWIRPANYIQQMPKAYEEYVGKIKLQQLPWDSSIQIEKISLFRSIVGSGIYLCQERYGVAFAVKELASRMSSPTAMSFHHLKKFLGYLKKTMDYCLILECPQAGEGYAKKGESYWRLGTFSDSDWSGDESHRTSTSGGFPLFNSSRTQIISLSSCEAELHALVSSASDGNYTRSFLGFALRTQVDHCIFTDSSSARQRVMNIVSSQILQVHANV